MYLPTCLRVPTTRLCHEVRLWPKDDMMENFIMVQKPFLHLVLGVTLLQTIMVTEAVSQCSRTRIRGHGQCHIYQLLPPDTTKRCQVGSHGSPNFSFYLRPGPSFTFLQIQVTARFGASATITVQKKTLSQPDRWYHIRMSSESRFFGARTDYHLYVDDQKRESVAVIFNKGNTFRIFTRGSPIYSPKCNPNQFPPPPSSPPPLTSPPRRLVPPSKAPGEPVASPQTSPPAPLTTTQSVPQSTEDFSTEDSIITLTTTNNNAAPVLQGLPWYIPVSIGSSAVVSVVIIIIIVVAVIRRSRKHDKENPWSLELGGSRDLRSSVDQTSGEVHDVQNHIYEELNDFGGATHEAASYPVEVRAGGGPGRPTLTRSSYTSENSIYVPFTSVMASS